MTKIRVHEYARQAKKSSREIVDELAKSDIIVNSHMAIIDADAIGKLDKSFGIKTEFKETPAPTSQASTKPKTQYSSGCALDTNT